MPMVPDFVDFDFRRNYKKRLKVYGDMGYDAEDLEKEMPAWMWKRFCDWMFGQTSALLDGKNIIYSWDLERFLAGLPPLD